MDAPLPLKTEFLFRMALSIGAPQIVGGVRGGELRVISITGGTVTGPQIKGEILPGTAADWLHLWPDGLAHIDVRATLRLEAGALVFMHYAGVRTGPPEVLARLGRGETVDPSEYYVHLAVRFETGDATFGWLNRVIAVGVGQRQPSGPVYEVYMLR